MDYHVTSISQLLIDIHYCWVVVWGNYTSIIDDTMLSEFHYLIFHTKYIPCSNISYSRDCPIKNKVYSEPRQLHHQCISVVSTCSLAKRLESDAQFFCCSKVYLTIIRLWKLNKLFDNSFVRPQAWSEHRGLLWQLPWKLYYCPIWYDSYLTNEIYNMTSMLYISFVKKEIY